MEETGPYSVADAVMSLVIKIRDVLPKKPSDEEVIVIAKMEDLDNEEAAMLKDAENEINKDPNVPEEVFRVSKAVNKDLIRHEFNNERRKLQTNLDVLRIHRSYNELERIAEKYCFTTSSSAGSSSSAAPTGPASSCDATTYDYPTSADTTLALLDYQTEDLHVPEEVSMRFHVPEEVLTGLHLHEELLTTLRRMMQNDHFWLETTRGQRRLLQCLYDSSISTLTLAIRTPIVHAVPIQSVRPSHSSLESPIVHAVPIQSVRPARRSCRKTHNLFMENYEGMDSEETCPSPSKRKRHKKGPAEGGPVGPAGVEPVGPAGREPVGLAGGGTVGPAGGGTVGPAGGGTVGPAEREREREGERERERGRTCWSCWRKTCWSC